MFRYYNTNILHHKNYSHLNNWWRTIRSNPVLSGNDRPPICLTPLMTSHAHAAPTLVLPKSDEGSKSNRIFFNLFKPVNFSFKMRALT